ncbi:hypothetical protein ORI20_26910 [Mycobacterium sp. CVI_P3]|uniref:Lipoprotein n=1 Tax=Mycobacterium pinniadriaticum TaxID=2994102 RepID=A0ABT3SLL2_9MYCO|nr:hypothetical protein [Mycobacterium pinniadriaticum]MCX2933906.1 hypothetical protein [Mycobacterium pinniadriaticum]MCX2940328.1 hypothetical protein [Mycobacterium pinniadriaticum]
MKRLAPSVAALLLVACGSATHTAETSSPPTAATKTVIDAQGVYRPFIDNDGTYVVGVDVPMGKYRNDGGTDCYWARLRSLDASDVIDSKKTSSPQEVEIRVSDTAFLTQGCGTWQMIPAL